MRRMVHLSVLVTPYYTHTAGKLHTSETPWKKWGAKFAEAAGLFSVLVMEAVIQAAV